MQTAPMDCAGIPSGVYEVVAPYDIRPLWSTFLDWRNCAIQTQPVPEPTGDSLT